MTTKLETSAEHAELARQVKIVHGRLMEQYDAAGKAKMVAFSGGKPLEAEKYAAIQQEILKALNSLRQQLGHYLKEKPAMQPCGVCGKLTPLTELIDACCRGCKRTS